jgi:twitching motility protein PilT
VPAIDTLLKAMVEAGASDLHLTCGEAPRVRVDGSMKKLARDSLDLQTLRQLLQQIAPAGNWTEFEETKDTDFAYEISGLARFRANYFRDMTGPGAVFRQIPTTILSAEQLGLPAAILELCTLHKGLVLVTGPTGSGKSTTLAAMIDHINATRDDHIITIEDPVEFVHPNKRCLINQRELGTHTRSFHSALRAALREDPDIILVGELRDLETVAIALEMAETGHLVFGTLHTTTAAQTVDRVVDQFPADQQDQIRTILASTLKGVISQTLLKKKEGGRVAALEVLLITNAVANYIREGKSHQIPMAMQTGRKLGMQELGGALLDLVREGIVTPEEALSKAVEREPLAKELARHGLMTARDARSPSGVVAKAQPAREVVDEARNRAIAAAARGLPNTKKKAWFS